MKPPATRKTKRKKRSSVPAQSRSVQVAQSRDGNIAADHDGGAANERDELNTEKDLGCGDLPPRCRNEAISESGSMVGHGENGALHVIQGNDDEKCRENLFGSFRRSRKQKTVAASAGIVSNFLSKDYVRPCAKNEGRKIGGANLKGNTRVLLSKEEAEEFLCSTLGNESEIHMGIVRDVLCKLLKSDLPEKLEISSTCLKSFNIGSLSWANS